MIRLWTAVLIACPYVCACGGTVTSTGGVLDGTGGADSGPSNWTMLGYDAQSTYWNRGETKLTKSTVASLEVAWEFDGIDGSYTGTPVIADGRVYIAPNAVVALDLATGEVVWRTADFKGTSSLALSDGVLYFHDGAGVVHALRAEDGEELWQYRTSELSSTRGFSSPVVTKDYVIVGGATLEEVMPAPAEFRGFVVAIHKNDGTLAWQTFTVEDPERGASVWSSVSVDESLGVVYAGTGNNHGPPAGSTSDAYLAIPLESGRGFRWTQQILAGDIWMLGIAGSPEYDFGANPVVFDFGGRKLVAGGNKGGDFWVLDRDTGAIIQKRNLGPGSAARGGVFVSGAWDGERLLTVCNNTTSTEPGSENATAAEAAVLYALDPLSLDIQWARQIRGPAYGPITVANGVGFFGKNTTLQAFDTATGQVLREVTTEGTIASAPAISNGYVVFGSGMNWVQATQGTKYYAVKVP